MTWDVWPWIHPINQAIRVQRAEGLAIVSWPSGRTTLERCAGVVACSDLECAQASTPDVLLQQKTESLHRSMREHQGQVEQTRYIIRFRRGRRKARRIATVDVWVKPSEYQGPRPGLGGVLPSTMAA